MGVSAPAAPGFPGHAQQAPTPGLSISARSSADAAESSEIAEETTRRRLGIAKPRLFTPPVRPLTPETTLGYAVVDWCRTALDWSPMPWQRWLLRHALASRADGRPQWRTVLVIVGRQNGKTECLTALS